jgi:DNA repair protein RecO
MFWLNTGEVHRTFRAITANLDALNLASYFCEVANLVSDQGTPAAELVRLLLNCLHALEKGDISHAVIKGVFEWRVMVNQGIFPALRCCGECEKADADDFSLDVAGGGLLCPSCRRRRESLAALSNQRADAAPMVLLTPAALQAIRFTVSTPLEKMFSFRLEDVRDEEIFTRAGERFFCYHLDTEPASLQMYHRMKN